MIRCMRRDDMNSSSTNVHFHGTNKIASADATSVVSNGATGQGGWRDVRFSLASLTENVFPMDSSAQRGL
jgi:hypothetical protein